MKAGQRPRGVSEAHSASRQSESGVGGSGCIELVFNYSCIRSLFSSATAFELPLLLTCWLQS